MEERIIDDEYARGIRLKKTKDGYVDATDELAEKERRAAEELEADELDATAEEENEAAGETEEPLVLDGLDESLEETAGEEVRFEFPDLEEDDEDLVNLTPEEAIALRKQKEAEEAERKATYKRLCEEGEELLVSGSFKAAELKFEKALGYDEEAVEAAVGYWRSKTSDFTSPDALAEEYAETGFESLENDLGESAVEKIKERYKSVFEGRLAALEEEEKPLEAEVLEKQEKRRAILKKRISSALKKTLCTGIPMAVLLICTIVFGVRIPTRLDGLFVGLTIGAGIACFICFILFGVFANKLVNARRINRANEDLSSTEDGEKLLKIRAYKELYSHFVG